MRRFVVLVVMALVFTVSISASGRSEEKSVLLIVRDYSADMPYMLDKEVGTMTRMLEEAGYRVIVASDTGKEIRGSTAVEKVGLRLARVRISDYAGVIVPCMAAGDAPLRVRVPESAVRVVAEAVEAGKPVAAQNSGVEILAKAGVMKGRRYAIDAPYFTLVPGGVFKGTGVIQDGTIITSGTCPYLARETGRPDGTVELTRKLISAMEAVR